MPPLTFGAFGPKQGVSVAVWQTVAAGEAALSPSGIRRVISELASRPNPQLPSPEQLDELTAREREVMALVAAGLSNDEIADDLVITSATAKTHVSRAMTKLGARDRARLVGGVLLQRLQPSRSGGSSPPSHGDRR